MHQVLEAKLLGPAGTVISIATEFIDNHDAASAPAGASQERIKQDCELKALRRLVAKLRAEFPQLRICLGGDGLYACGEGFQVAKDYRCDYIYTFKPGRLPALWEDFQGLLRLCPRQQVERTTPQGLGQVYRWVNGLHYTDSAGRDWTVNALECTETDKEGKKTEWSWVTSLDLSHETVVEVATNGGRQRWREENEGFNTQKNSGLNLEHAYSHTCWPAYYFLLQIAHLLLQLVEKGSLLRHLAQEQGKRTAVELFGSLKNMAQRLLESLRYRHWPDEVFDRPGPVPSRSAWTAVSRRWRVGVFQVQPGSSGLASALEAAFEPVPLRPLPDRTCRPASRPQPGQPRPGVFLRAAGEGSGYQKTPVPC